MNRVGIDEFAKAASVSRRTVHRWIEAGKVESEKHGKSRVILIEGDALMSQNVLNVTKPKNDTNDVNVTEDMTEDVVDEKVNITLLDLKDREILLLEQQLEFFKTELQRLQVELTLVSAKNKGLFGRLRGLFGLRRELPQT